MDYDETQIATESQLDAAAVRLASLPNPPVTSLKIGSSEWRVQFIHPCCARTLISMSYVCVHGA